MRVSKADYHGQHDRLSKDDFNMTAVSTVNGKQDEEERRNVKWLSFTKSKVSFGFKHLPPVVVPTMSNDSRAFAVCFDKICNWSVPSQVLAEFEKGDFEMVVQLSLSMFHLASSSFFGSTWMGPEIELPSDLPKYVDFKYEDIVYMLTRITDPSCVGVVEVVVTKLDRRRNLKATQFGCGWTMINFFSKPDPPDICHGHENIALTSCSMFAGSPRDLILNNDVNTISTKLKELPDCNIFFKLYSHQRMLKAQRLISDNESIGRFDAIPGLVCKPVTPPGATQVKSVACIGDEERVDQNGVTILPARPSLAIPTLLKIANCQLSIPNREKLELLVNESFSKDLSTEDGEARPQILSRVLKIGLHNGHTIIGGDWRTYRLLEDEQDREILYTAEEVLSLPGYVPHELMALVFIVEYEVGVPKGLVSHFDAKNMVDVSITDPKRQLIVHGLTLGTVVFIPSDGRTISLKNTSTADHRVDEEDEQGVDIELTLLRNEVCSVLSPKPLLQDPTIGLTGEERKTPMDSKMSRTSIDSLRTSKNRHSFGLGRLPAVAEEKGVAAKGLKSSHAHISSDLDSMVLGFDLKALHPVAGELLHGDDVEELTQQEDKSATVRGSLRLSLEEEDEERGDGSPAVLTGGRSSWLRTSKESGRFTPGSRHGKQLDFEATTDFEKVSVADSVVTGDSDHSHLRLDPYYYGNNREKDAVQDTASETSSVGSKRVDDRLVPPKNPESLLARSLATKLISQDAESVLMPSRHRANGELMPSTGQSMQSRLIVPKTTVAINGIASHVREIPRAGRSRLNRHGFEGALVENQFETALQQVHALQKDYRGIGGKASAVGRQVIDLERESGDVLAMHEVTIQFAGFVGKSSTASTLATANGAVQVQAYENFPRNIYTSFQFYTCRPTRTEIMRVLRADKSDRMCVLARSDPSAYQETPLALRYLVDCSSSSPLEAYEFAEYLARETMFVEVWDADSLILLGLAGIPLRKLMRQREPFTKCSMECDIINYEVVSESNGGIATCVIADGGPVAGSVVGGLQVILSNSGRKGKGPSPNYIDNIAPIQQLNWRAFGVENYRDPSKLPSKGKAIRPKNSTRAKPLSESSPELSRALSDVRHERPLASMRSLQSGRGGESRSTLDYDEVAVIFKRFQGPNGGTVQYAGDLMALLDVPSSQVATRKLVSAFRKYGDHEGFRREMLRYSGADSRLGKGDLEEFFRDLFERIGIHITAEEVTLLSQKFLSHSASGDDERKERDISITPAVVIDFCANESDRQEWTLVGNRLRRAAQKAYLDNCDVEQLLSEYDKEGAGYLNSGRFKEFLRELSKYGRLSGRDLTLCCKYFSRRPQNADVDRDPISLRDVMSFLGRDYVGNIESRMRSIFRRSGGDTRGGKRADSNLVISFARTLREGNPTVAGSGAYTFEEIESALRSYNIFGEVTHEQARRVLQQADKKKSGRLTAIQVCAHLGLDFDPTEVDEAARVFLGKPENDGKKGGLSIEAAAAEVHEVDTAELFAILLAKVHSNGVAVDEAFRHFDQNGDGSITAKELADGLHGLCIFDHIPNWKRQIPEIVKQFDADGDGEVSLREFFKFLKVDYAPNIIQRMTKIFALATQKGLKFKDIFNELDADGDGTIDVNEIVEGLKKLGTFGEVTREDALSVVGHFDQDGDQKISIDEFTSFFGARVEKVLLDRRRRHTEKIAKRFRDVMMTAQSKGVTAKDIFGHFDKDGGGSISSQELAEALKVFPNFKSLSASDIDDLIAILDYDKSGDISLEEFETFVKGDGSDSVPEGGLTIVDALKDVFKTAQAKGLSFQSAFALLDKDGSGEISLAELELCLKKFPSFKQMKHEQFKKLFVAIDTDSSGLITVDEFEAFVRGGKRIADKVRYDEDSTAHEQNRLRGAKQDARVHDAESSKDMLVRHIHRIAEIDGSIGRFLAFLDDDEDGLIDLATFKNQLRREDVFEYLPEDQFEAIIAPVLFDRRSIKVTALLKFIEGRPLASDSRRNPLDEEDDDKAELKQLVVREFEFSRDPETRRLEKKLRAFGRTLARAGLDVEGLFREFDRSGSGSIRRTEFVEALSRMGMYLLEHGRALSEANSPENDLRRLQIRQINRIRGAIGGDYLHNAPRMARKFLMGATKGSQVAVAVQEDFKEHLESMMLVNWYRQGQKQNLLQRVLAHSLAFTIHLYPRFGKTLFFEFPLTNPFAHEERFVIEIDDSELRVVTSFDEWAHLRATCRPCTGELGDEPAEADMFDTDGLGRVQVALMPHETLFIPFTFMTLLPFLPEQRNIQRKLKHSRKAVEAKGEKDEAEEGEEEEGPRRTAEAKCVSGTHGHIVAILRALIFPRPYAVQRTLRFLEPENSVMKRRLQLVGHENASAYPGEYTVASKYVHCVEGACSGGGSAVEGESRVVVEWSGAGEHFRGLGSLDLLVRYRCGAFPASGSFFLLIYNDPYQIKLHEVWRVVVQSAQRLDAHAAVGSSVHSDLVIRGDRYARRAQAFGALSLFDRLQFQPPAPFQLVPGAYNKVALVLHPLVVGNRRIQVNVVDVDSRELIMSWILIASITTPAVMRTYDIDLMVGRPMHKKIVFKNPWDVARRFALSSSDVTIMKPRSNIIDVAPFGSAYIRLWFNGLEAAASMNMNTSTGALRQSGKEVYLFLNDSEGGQNEECYLFKVREGIPNDRIIT